MKMLKKLKQCAPHLLISATFSMMIAAGLVIYNGFSETGKTDIRPYPNLLAASPRLQSVRIVSPECSTDLIKKGGENWVLSSGRDYPASKQATLNFFRDVSEWRLIEKRKAGAGIYEKLHLNDPLRPNSSSKHSASGGLGSRVTVTDGRASTVSDFIIGKRVSGYFGGAEKRFYFRYANASDIYIAEAKQHPVFCAGDFLTDDLGLPPFQKVEKIESFQGNQKLFTLEKAGAGKNAFFTPAGLPDHLRLIYPNAANDFVQILTEKIRPLSIYPIPREKLFDAVTSAIVFYTADKQPVRAEFWKEGDFNFMSLIGTDKAFNDQTLYRISDETYKILAQPISPLLTPRAGSTKR